MEPVERPLDAPGRRRRRFIWIAVASGVAVVAVVVVALVYLLRSGSAAAVAASTASARSATTTAASSASSTTAATETTAVSDAPAGTSAPTGGQPAGAATEPATVPGAPTQLTWTQDPGKDMPHWSAPASDGGAAITGYRVTLLDLTLNQSRTETWRPADVGLRHWGCLSNGFPEDQDHYFTYDVAAVNAVGTGPAVTSPQIIGQRC